MALILMEGFDHYSSSYGAGYNQAKGWSGTFWQSIPGRLPFSGGQGAQAFGAHDVTKILPSSYSEIVIGFAVKLFPNALWDYNGTFLTVRSATSGVASFGVDAGYLRLSDAAGTHYLGPALPVDSWIYLEAKISVGASESVDVRMNGASAISDTGADFGSDNIDRIVLSAETLCLMGFDDIYVLDTTGGAPTDDFLGDVVVKTLYPRADGAHSDWTPLSGADHFAMVDEHVMDADTTYIYDAAAGDIDSFPLNPITSPVIYATQLNIAARKGDATVREVAPLVRQGGVDYVGPTVAVSTDWLFYSWRMTQDPASSDWTDTTINADEFGVKVIT